MDRVQLAETLHRRGVKESAYDLHATGKDEAVTLDNVQGTWYVYYSERGEQSGKVSFDSEDAACRRVLEMLMRDPSALKDYVPPPFKPSRPL